MKKAFLICPVRGANMKLSEVWATAIEVAGYQLHWPWRDTNQDDPTGLKICRQNAEAIAGADVVFFMWDGKSQGCLFDLGMAFAMRKPLKVLEAHPSTPGEKSFQAMAVAWEESGP